ncbi:MAG TPA: methionine--tRNA ligase subunit beta [Polyangia bacterium]|nr:methionine--tRNA ligase subunit beta [Polyangia bacterium]
MESPKKEPTPTTATNEIAIDEFNKVDLRVAVVKEAGLVEGADKLIRVVVDLGEGRDRQIFAGLRQSYPDPSVLVGKRVVVVANLKPRQMKFGLSEGMILAAGKMVLAADESAKPGDKVS